MNWILTAVFINSMILIHILVYNSPLPMHKHWLYELVEKICELRDKSLEVRDNSEICILYSITYEINTSVQFSCSVVFDSLRPHGLQHTRLPCPSPTSGVYPNSCPYIDDAIQPSHPLSFPSPPAFCLSQHRGLFQWVSSSHEVAKVLEFQF